jgi:GNAT superfamily N-acetyltransferase
MYYSSAIIFRTELTMTAEMGIATVHMGGPRVNVVGLGRDQWQIIKVLRLAALQDAPGSFFTTSAAERALTPRDWQDRFNDASWLTARVGLEFAGIARLAPPEDGLPWVRFVESVWVEPRHRGQGVLRNMMEHLEALARIAGATELRLWVLDTNESAERAYQKLGFDHMFGSQATAKRLADGTPVMEKLMSKLLL